MNEQAKGGYPLEEMDAALAVGTVAPEKLNDYLLLRSRQIRQGSWVTTLDELGIDYKKVKEVMQSKTIEQLTAQNNKLAEELGIAEGSVVLITNNRIFKAFDINQDLLQKMF